MPHKFFFFLHPPPPRLYFSNWLGILRNINSRQALHLLCARCWCSVNFTGCLFARCPWERGIALRSHAISSYFLPRIKWKGIQKTSFTCSGYIAGHTEDWINNVDTKPQDWNTHCHTYAKKMDLLFTALENTSHLPDRLYFVFLWTALFYLRPRWHSYKYGYSKAPALTSNACF